MNQPIRMHNIRKRMGKMAPDVMSSIGTSKCKVLENGRQVAVDADGREVDPIELFARFGATTTSFTSRVLVKKTRVVIVNSSQ